MNNYRTFAQVYDRLMTDYPYDEVYQWIVKKTGDYGLESDFLLEMACGTGSLTSRLLSLGKVDAFDLSPDMLAMAQNKIKYSRELRLFQMDMRSFQMDRKYDMIICLCDSLNYIESEDLDQVFRQVSDHLNPGGLWLFDLNTGYNFKTNFKDDNFIFDLDEVYCVWENFYDESRGENHYHLNIFQPVGDLYERSIEDHIEYVHSTEEIKYLIDRHGMKLLSLNDGYTDEEYRDTSLRSTWTVTKEE